MYSLKFYLALCAIAMCLVVVYSDEGKENKKAMMKCDGQDFKKPEEDEAKKFMEGKKACWEQFAPTEGDMKEKMIKVQENTCYAVCNWKKSGVLDDKGAFMKAKTEENAKKTYPTTELADAMIAGINACAKDNGLEDGKALSMDDDCKAYKPYKLCLMKKHIEVCKITVPAKEE